MSLFKFFMWDFFLFSNILVCSERIFGCMKDCKYRVIKILSTSIWNSFVQCQSFQLLFLLGLIELIQPHLYKNKLKAIPCNHTQYIPKRLSHTPKQLKIEIISPVREKAPEYQLQTIIKSLIFPILFQLLETMISR